MKSDIVRALTSTFEGHAQQTDSGVEYWLARDVQHLLGYAEWRNFTTVISKARTACEVSGHPVTHHFVDVNKMVDLGSGSQREDAKEKRSTMETCWVPGVNPLGTHGRWAFAEFTEVYQIEADFKGKVEAEFDKMIDGILAVETY